MKRRYLLILGLFLLNSCNDDSVTTPEDETPVELPNIVINEFLASNNTCCTDPDGVDEYNDWIELYNADSEAVDIGGWYVSDDKSNPKKFRIQDNAPDKTTIPAGGYLLLWADNDTEQGPLHLDFALSADGEDVGIYGPEGSVVDEYSFPAQTTDVSTGRSPNGTGSWITFEAPSPGASNQ